MSIRDVKIVALIAPSFVENLFELFLRLQVHPERRIQSSLPGLRWVTISVDEEQRWWLRRPCLATTSSATTKTAAGSVNQLMPISLRAAGGYPGGKGRARPIAARVPMKGPPPAPEPPATATSPSAAGWSLKVVNRTRNTGV